MKEFWPRPSRPSATSGILTSRHFPDDFQGNFLNGNVIGFLGFYRVRIEDDGSGLKGERQPDFLSSTDSHFRPVGISVGPDGAVYPLDWHNPIIGHMQHHLRDPNRDDIRGRIYRVTHASRPSRNCGRRAADSSGVLADKPVGLARFSPDCGQTIF